MPTTSPPPSAISTRRSGFERGHRTGPDRGPASGRGAAAHDRRPAGRAALPVHGRRLRLDRARRAGIPAVATLLDAPDPVTRQRAFLVVRSVVEAMPGKGDWQEPWQGLGRYEPGAGGPGPGRRAVAGVDHLARLNQNADGASTAVPSDMSAGDLSTTVRSAWTIRRRIAEMQLMGYRMDQRILRVDQAEVERLLRPIPTGGALSLSQSARPPGAALDHIQ